MGMKLFRMKSFRRQEDHAWEVVESKAVDRIPMYYDDEDLDLGFIADADMCGTYLFELKKGVDKSKLRNALIFARQQLLQEAAAKQFNILLQESWQLTLYRRGKLHRIEVRYSGRPANAIGKLPSPRSPPYLGLVEREDHPLTP